jgi:hypothetical protein
MHGQLVTTEGTQTLNEALGDRFVYTLKIPEFLDLTEKQKKELVQQSEEVDEHILLKYVKKEPNNNKYKSLVTEIQDYLNAVGRQWLEVNNLKIEDYMRVFATTYGNELKKADKLDMFSIGSRRVNNLIKAIKSNIAVELFEYNNYIKGLSKEQKKNNQLNTEEMTSWLRETIYKVIIDTVNIELTGKKINIQAISTAHDIALKEIDANQITPLYKILKEKNPVKRFYKSVFFLDLEPLEIHKSFDMLALEVEKIYSQETLQNTDPNYWRELFWKQIQNITPLIALESKVGQFRDVWDKIGVELQQKVSDLLFREIQEEVIDKTTKEKKMQIGTQLLESINDLSPKMLEYFDFKYDIFEKGLFHKQEDIKKYFNYQNEEELLEKYIVLILILFYEVEMFDIIGFNTSYIQQTYSELKTLEKEGQFIPLHDSGIVYKKGQGYEETAAKEIEDFKNVIRERYENWVDPEFIKIVKEAKRQVEVLNGVLEEDNISLFN